jgi:hypothetical protein
VINAERASYHCSTKVRRQNRSLVEIMQVCHDERVGERERERERAGEREREREREREEFDRILWPCEILTKYRAECAWHDM